MNLEKLIIKSENEGSGRLFTVVILENHFKHILYHLPYIWKPRIFFHCIEHIKMHMLKKKQGLPTIELDTIMERYR